MYLCLFPYKPNSRGQRRDPQTVVVSAGVEPRVSPWWSRHSNLLLLSALVGDWRFAVAIWLGRAFCAVVNMIQNYWTHDRRYGYRRYEDGDNRDEHR